MLTNEAGFVNWFEERGFVAPAGPTEVPFCILEREFESVTRARAARDAEVA